MFICPECRRRCRFLYLPEYKCRFCAKLNYGIQQRSRGSRENATDILVKHFDCYRKDVGDFTPARPRYMHRSKYQKLLARYRKYQDAYSIREYMRLLRICGSDWLDGLLSIDELID